MAQIKYVGSHDKNSTLKQDRENYNLYCDLTILVKKVTIQEEENVSQSPEHNEEEDSPTKRTKRRKKELKNEMGLEEVKVHKLVLMQISDYFKKTLTVDMTEKYNNTIDLSSHFDADTIRSIIDFIYDGEIILTRANVEQILYGADYLQLQELQCFCESFLECQVDLDNCFSFYNLSKMYNLQMLRQKTLIMICNLLRDRPQSCQDDFLKFTFQDMQGLSGCPHSKGFCVSVLNQACIKWVKHDVVNRKRFLFDLMTRIDFKKLKMSYLNAVVAKEELIQRSAPCVKLLVDAIDYHLRPENLRTEQEKEILEEELLKDVKFIRTTYLGGYYKLDDAWCKNLEMYAKNNGYGWESNMTRDQWHCLVDRGLHPGPIDNSPLISHPRKSCKYVCEEYWHHLVSRYGILSDQHAIKMS